MGAELVSPLQMSIVEVYKNVSVAIVRKFKPPSVISPNTKPTLMEDVKVRQFSKKKAQNA